MKPVLIFVFIFVSSCLYSQQVEDWIYFKDSTLVKGLVVEIKGGGVEVETSDGLQKFRLHKIAKIVKQHPDLMEKKVYNQTAKGAFKIGGLFSLSYLNYEIPRNSYIGGDYYYNSVDRSSASLQLSPSFMYFLLDNFGCGILLNIEGRSYAGSDMKFEKGFGVNLQYYFASGNARPFINAQGLYTIADENGYSYTAGAGLSFSLGKNVALQPLIQYGRTAISGADSKEMFIYSVGLAYFITGEIL